MHANLFWQVTIKRVMKLRHVTIKTHDKIKIHKRCAKIETRYNRIHVEIKTYHDKIRTRIKTRHAKIVLKLRHVTTKYMPKSRFIVAFIYYVI